MSQTVKKSSPTQQLASSRQGKTSLKLFPKHNELFPLFLASSNHLSDLDRKHTKYFVERIRRKKPGTNLIIFTRD